MSATPEEVQFVGPKGTVFVWLREPQQVSIFARGATIGVLGGRRGWHQEVPIEDLVAVGEHAKARWL